MKYEVRFERYNGQVASRFVDNYEDAKRLKEYYEEWHKSACIIER